MNEISKIKANKLVLLFLLYFINTTVKAQQVGIGTNSPNPSAILDIESTNSGLLIPRMTTIQRLAISNPAKGLLVFDNTTNSFWFYNGTTWGDLSSTNSIFENASGVVRNTGTNSSDDFVFGAPSLNYDSIYNNRNKFFFDKSKGAFRVGHSYNNNWDIDSIGDYSFASGYSSKAIGFISTAMGSGSIASGGNSFAVGYRNKAIGGNSIALGSETISSGNASIAIGHLSKATGNSSTALGNATRATALASTSFGHITEASGVNSTAFGSYTKSTGSNSTASGSNTESSGRNSTSLGFNTKSNGFSSTVLGEYNDTLVAVQTVPNSNTPLLIVGNGTFANRSNAFVVKKNGSVQINEEYDLPLLDGSANQILKTNGTGITSFVDATSVFTDNDNQNLTISNDTLYIENGNYAYLKPLSPWEQIGGVLRTNGSTSSPSVFIFGARIINNTANSSKDSKMFFHKSISAFRAGEATNKNWDIDSLGYNSFAGGFNTKAIGPSSTALGLFSEATGIASTSLGHYTNACGKSSTAMGLNTDANGNHSTAMGRYTNANGESSTSMGDQTTTYGYGSLVIGMHNDPILSAPDTITDLATPLFIVGNGTYGTPLFRSNAFVVRKDGRVQINEEYDLPTLDGTANQILATNGSGITSFVDASTVFTNTDNQTISLSGTDLIISNGNTLDISTINSNTQNSLNQAYNEGGAGAGRTITANSGDVKIQGTDGFTITGTFGSGITAPITGAGTRMFFNPRKGAFRAGQVNGSQWDNANIGEHSIAMGYRNTASGNRSVSFGNQGVSSGGSSTTMGYRSKASGATATAIGNNTKAKAANSFAIGTFTQINNKNATVVGMYNDTVTAVQTTVVNTSPLFIVGNGTNASSRSNAMVVTKEGRVGIGTNTPFAELQVVGSIYASGTITSSDKRYKKDIKTLENATETLAKINPVSYHFRTKEFPKQFDNKKQFGVIAQELEKIVPNIVFTDGNGYKGVNYTALIPLLIKSNQEQQNLINEQNKKIEELYEFLLRLKKLND